MTNKTKMLLAQMLRKYEAYRTATEALRQGYHAAEMKNFDFSEKHAALAAKGRELDSEHYTLTRIIDTVWKLYLDERNSKREEKLMGNAWDSAWWQWRSAVYRLTGEF